MSAKAEVIYAIKSRGRVPWFGFDVYDGRLVFLNCAELESLSLVEHGERPTRFQLLTR
jgi:hypothetical protein